VDGLAVDFDKYIAAYERGLDDRDFIVDAENVVEETSTSSYRRESDFNKQRSGVKSGKNKRREFPLPVDYAKYRKPVDEVAIIPSVTTTTQKLMTTEVQEMPALKLDDLEVLLTTPALNPLTTPISHNPYEQHELYKSQLIEHKTEIQIPPNAISSYVVANNKIDLINLSEASIIAPMLAAVGKSLFIPFALELCEIGEIRSELCIDSEVWGEMCPVEIKGAGGLKHTVNLPSSSGVYVAPTYITKQLGDIFILRNSSFTMDLMMRRDSGQIEIGHKLQSPTGAMYGTVIHYGTIASHKDSVGEVWMLVQRITDGWHIPMKTKPVKTVLTGSSQIIKAATPVFDARISTKEVVIAKLDLGVKPNLLFDPIGGKGFDLYPKSIF